MKKLIAQFFCMLFYKAGCLSYKIYWHYPTYYYLMTKSYNISVKYDLNETWKKPKLKIV